MRVRVHPRIAAKRPEIQPDDVKAAWDACLRSVARDTDPVKWVGVGLDDHGRLLEFIAIEEGQDDWLIYHAMPVTKSVLAEVGLGGRR